MSRPHGCKNKNGYKLSEKAMAARKTAAKKFTNPGITIRVDCELNKRVREIYPNAHEARKFIDKAIADALDALGK